MIRLLGFMTADRKRPGTATDRAEARDRIAAAVLRDPDAILTFGFNLNVHDDEQLRVAGAAWMMVACRAGADCGANSGVIPMGMCTAMGALECTPGMDFDTRISTALGPTLYARAYALHEELARELRSGDVDAIKARLSYCRVYLDDDQVALNSCS